MRRISLLALVLLPLGPVLAARAATPDSSAAPGTHFVVSEVGFSRALGRHDNDVDNESVEAAGGYLWRTGGHSLVGADAEVSAHTKGVELAIRPRVRYELGRRLVANLAAGPILLGGHEELDLKGVGLSAGAGLDYRGLVGFRLSVRSAEYGYDAVYQDIYTTLPAYRKRVTSTRLGLVVGGEPGALSIVALFVVGMIAAVGYDSVGL